MRIKDEIEYANCIECGEEFPIDMMEDCMECFDGPFCPDCLDAHEREHNVMTCKECQKELEDDPPCPICKAELCDDCLPLHVKKCKFQHELGKQQRLITQFLPIEGMET